MDPILLVRTFGGTATPGVDYTALDGVVTVPAGATQKDVFVTTFDDNIVELSSVETYNLSVANVNAGDLAVGGDLLAEGRIFENTPANPRPAIVQFGSDPVPSGSNLSGRCRPNLDVGEAFIDPSEIVLRLTIDLLLPFGFEFRLFTDVRQSGGIATPGTDFVPFDTVVVFPAQTRSITFVVRILDDGVTEDSESFAIRATGPMIQDSQPCLQNLLEAISDVVCRNAGPEWPAPPRGSGSRSTLRGAWRGNRSGSDAVHDGLRR